MFFERLRARDKSNNDYLIDRVNETRMQRDSIRDLLDEQTVELCELRRTVKAMEATIACLKRELTGAKRELAGALNEIDMYAAAENKRHAEYDI